MLLIDLERSILERMGDLAQQVWTSAEVKIHLTTAAQKICTIAGLFFDLDYLEDLPQGFNYTAPWEREYLDQFGGLDFGCANYTCLDDINALGDEPKRLGPANYTAPSDQYDGHTGELGLDENIPATATVPDELTALERVTWDKRGIDAMEARKIGMVDRRYEITKGEVYGYVWEKDGINVLRKVRVPAALANVIVPDGLWGSARDLADDLRPSEPISGTWGVARIVPGHFPGGSSLFGTPRRAYLEEKNFRLEFFRQNAPFSAPDTILEFPVRYALYLRDYTQWQLFNRRGPGQDLKLAAHFKMRWDRDVARITRRIEALETEHVGVLGGDETTLGQRPPRPKLPWPYGSVVR